MKRFLLTLAIILIAAQAWAVGSISDTTVTPDGSFGGDSYYIYKLTCTGDAGDGTIPATATTLAIRGFIMFVETNPGSTAPTDNYDLTLVNSNGVDVMGGALADRDTSVSEQASPIVGAGLQDRYINETLTVTPTGNSVGSATFTVWIYVRR